MAEPGLESRDHYSVVAAKFKLKTISTTPGTTAKAIILSLVFINIFQTQRSIYNSFNLLIIFFCIIMPIINYGSDL